MKKVFVLLMILTIITTALTGCVSDYNYETTKNTNKVLVTPDDVMKKHEEVWHSEKTHTNNRLYVKEDLSLNIRVGDVDTNVTFKLANDKLDGIPTSINSVVVIDENNKKIALITLSENVGRKSDKYTFEEITDFSVTSEYDWKCYKTTSSQNKEIYIFEYTDDTNKNFGNYVVEISGTDLIEVSRTVSALNIASKLSVILSAISNEFV